MFIIISTSCAPFLAKHTLIVLRQCLVERVKVQRRKILECIQCRSQNKAEEAIPPLHPRNKLAKIFTGALYQFSTVTMTCVTDDVTDWPLQTKLLGYATEFVAANFLICEKVLFKTRVNFQMVSFPT